MARDKDKPATLNELTGKDGPAMRLEELPKILGEKMPELPFDSRGKIRLMRALKNRFGEGFKNIPGVKGILKDFEREMKVARLIKMNRRR